MKNWPNNVKLIKNEFIKFRIHYGCIENNKQSFVSLSEEIKEHYNSLLVTPPTNKYLENSFAGGFFILQKAIINIYANIYDKKLQYYFSNNYVIKDDQTILLDIIVMNPSLFYVHFENNPMYDNWFMFQRLLL